MRRTGKCELNKVCWCTSCFLYNNFLYLINSGISRNASFYKNVSGIFSQHFLFWYLKKKLITRRKLWFMISLFFQMNCTFAISIVWNIKGLQRQVNTHRAVEVWILNHQFKVRDWWIGDSGFEPALGSSTTSSIY